jgi:Reverse transcriptase (RNA-dependent DNA polymerase)
MFSPMVRPTTIRLVLMLEVHNSWPLKQLDVHNVFLHDDLQETVYMHQSPGFTDPAYPTHVCLLNKALYDFKQSLRAWFQTLNNFLLSRFSCIRTWPFTLCSSFLRWHGYYSYIIHQLQTRFAIKDLDDLHYFLGIKGTSNISWSSFISTKVYLWTPPKS